MFRPTFQTIRKLETTAIRPLSRTSTTIQLRSLHLTSRPTFRSTLHPRFNLNQRRTISFSLDRLPYPVSFCIRLTISAVVGITALGGVILIHDAFTYQDRHVDRVPTNPLSLHPRLGGPKGLPIVEVPLGENEDVMGKKKPKLVIVGGGWGAVAVLKALPSDQYTVTVVAPDNFNLFTPLLPSACVGTVEPRSLVEPLRKLIARVRGHYMMGAAVDLDMSEKLLEVEVPSDNKGGTMRCYVPYDKLVIAVGSTSNTHGVPGLEHSFQLKTIPDAQAIRRRIMTNLELASLPTTTPEERRRLLSFVVCGGGPTGVEFAAELADMMSEDVLNYFPAALRNDMTVKVIQSRDHILNTYSEKISQYAEKRFARSAIDVITNARVSAIHPDRVSLTVRDPNHPKEKAKPVDIPAGFVLWSTGIAMNPFVRRLVQLLPNQYNKKAIQVDDQLRVKGAPLGTVYALGDAATIETNLVDHLMDIFEDADTNKDSKLDYEEWQRMVDKIKRKYPLAGSAFDKIKDIFDQYDADKDEEWTLNDAARAFQELSRKITTLPATAQVAAQQGQYLGKKFSYLAKHRETLEKNGLTDQDDGAYHKPFKYLHLGSLAYIGNSAVFDLNGYSFAGGLLAMYAWRSVYWSEQTSLRTRVLLMTNWVTRGIFGRDLSKF